MLNHEITNEQKSNLMYYRLYSKYKMLALNMFEWEGLPNEIKPRYIENALFSSGQCVMFYDKEKEKYLVLKSSNSEKFNVYNESLLVMAHGFNFNEQVLLINEKDELEEIDIRKGVRCLNNELMLSTHIFVDDYAKRMCDVEKSINLNIRQQKFPNFIKCDRDTELTLRTLFDEVEEGQTVNIFGSKSVDLTGVEVLNIQSPYVADKLHNYKYELDREILTFFGLNNTFEKKERMLVDEVNSNNDYIEEFPKLMEKERIEFCEIANKVFGLNMSVKRKNKIEFIEVEEEEE